MKHQIQSLLFVCFFVFSSCNVQNTKNYSTTSTDEKNAIPENLSVVIDYSSTNNWAVLPGNYPNNLKNYPIQNPHDSIDVFYVYPTLLVSDKDKRWNVPIDDSIQRNKVLNVAVRFQASAWASSGNMYIPYYRQAHIRSYSQLENGGTTALLLAYSDVKAAFEYYLKHYNHGRGIILAGHSQGSTQISWLLRDFLTANPCKISSLRLIFPE